MKRLTKKYKKAYIANLQNVSGHCFQSKETVANMHIYKKLGTLEDIENDLGISLITLLKLAISDIYVKNGLGEITLISSHEQGFNINLTYKAIILSTNYYFKDYGKTWALTKKELIA